jgi:hypothetical protein
MKRAWNIILTGAVLAAASTQAAPDFKKDARPILAEYCLSCHSTAKHKGDLDLEQFASLADVKKHPKIWQGVIEQIDIGEMPPKDKPQLSARDKERLLKFAKGALNEIARANAGDPGHVVLRRLSNAEYTYTLRDITGVSSLDPAREFPVDGAAGEGFMNVGNALVMSPALLTKYLDAGRQVAEHAVLVPDGIRFSAGASRRDWTDEMLARIRAFYGEFTEQRGADKVNLQGVIFDTNEGGRIPLEKYLAATLDLPESPRAREKAIQARAEATSLSARYLASVAGILSTNDPSILLDPIRARWRTAKASDVPALAAEIEQWQKAVWKFNAVGQIGREDAPKSWLESVTPIAAKQDIRLKLAAPEKGDVISLFLTIRDAGDGNTNDFAVWKAPRLVAPGRPDLLLRDVREVTDYLIARRQAIFADAAKYLAAASEASAASAPTKPEDLAKKHNLPADAMAAWLDYLGLGAGDAAKIDSHFTNVIKSSSGFDFVQGWGVSDTPLFIANSSTNEVRVPGVMKAHGVAMHPSPTLQAAVGWRSPISGKVRVEARIKQAHPECGNGVTWSLELRRAGTRRRLASGISEGGKEQKPDAIENLSVRAGDLISILVGPRDGNHSCDLTAVDLVIKSSGVNEREWNLASDVSPNILAANPHADRFGNEAVWSFYTEPDKGGNGAAPVIPQGSLLARWDAAPTAEEKASLARDLQKLLAGGKPPDDAKSPDAQLFQQLNPLGGSFFAGLLRSAIQSAGKSAAASGGVWGLDPASFGKHPNGRALDKADLCAQAPQQIEIRLPADLAAGWEFATTGELDPETGSEGSVQFQAAFLSGERTRPRVLRWAPSPAASEAPKVDEIFSEPANPSVTLVAREGSAARARIENAMNRFRDVFPAALCYPKIVPVDEVITLTLFYREDDQLRRLMLNDAQAAKIDRLWDELRFISQDALTLVDAYEQLYQYATQDRPDVVKSLEPMKQGFLDRAKAFRERMTNAQPAQINAVLKFAEDAYRRPLAANERDGLRALYDKLRAQELSHEEALRLTLARILVAPAFLYHAEEPAPGARSAAVSNWELANRLSYFLWSSAPDAELRAAAAAGKLTDAKVMPAQTKRLLRDDRMRRMAKEFGAAWLHIYGFDELGEKSERHFPMFAALRADMYEESIRFFADLFQRDGSVLEIIDADHTFLNEPLAKLYGIPGVAGANWRRVDGVKAYARGGILGQAATLAKQSGASRTSPILRGNWLSEVLLGEKLPKPPPNVPQLPEDEATDQLTVRELTEKHSSDPRCQGCHKRIDAFGFSLEAFDAIGRHRERDLADRPINTSATTLDGAKIEGVDGLRNYLLTTRRDAFVKQFCRKLLGYSLGRAVQLSDDPLLEEMQSKLKRNTFRVSAAINVIVQSRQFREIRGRESASDE